MILALGRCSTVARGNTRPLCSPIGGGPPFHPNCVYVLTPFVERLATKEERKTGIPGRTYRTVRRQNCSGGSEQSGGSETRRLTWPGSTSRLPGVGHASGEGR